MSIQTAWHSEARDKYKGADGLPANHDRAMAEAVTLADGGTAWVAAVADGCGGDDRGTRVAQLALDRLREAVASASTGTLAHAASASKWAAEWGGALQREIVAGPLRGGNSTLSAGILVRDSSQSDGFRLLMLNVGDSPAYLFAGTMLDRRGVVPDAPPDNPNTAENGKSLVRAVGLPANPRHSLFDTEVIALDRSTLPCILFVSSDGAVSFRDKPLLYPRDFKQVIAAEASSFPTLPQRLLERSLANANREGFSKLDNSSVALLGIELETAPFVIPPVAPFAAPPASREPPPAPPDPSPVSPDPRHTRHGRRKFIVSHRDMAAAVAAQLAPAPAAKSRFPRWIAPAAASIVIALLSAFAIWLLSGDKPPQPDPNPRDPYLPPYTNQVVAKPESAPEAGVADTNSPSGATGDITGTTDNTDNTGDIGATGDITGTTETTDNTDNTGATGATGWETYTVKNGDALKRIAKKLACSVDDLVEWNDITDQDMILAGQKLRYKRTSATAEPPPSTPASSDPQAGGSRLSRPPSSTASSGESGEAAETPPDRSYRFLFPANVAPLRCVGGEGAEAVVDPRSGVPAPEQGGYWCALPRPERKSGYETWSFLPAKTCDRCKAAKGVYLSWPATSLKTDIDNDENGTSGKLRESFPAEVAMAWRFKRPADSTNCVVTLEYGGQTVTNKPGATSAMVPVHQRVVLRAAKEGFPACGEWGPVSFCFDGQSGDIPEILFLKPAVFEADFTGLPAMRVAGANVKPIPAGSGVVRLPEPRHGDDPGTGKTACEWSLQRDDGEGCDRCANLTLKGNYAVFTEEESGQPNKVNLALAAADGRNVDFSKDAIIKYEYRAGNPARASRVWVEFPGSEMPGKDFEGKELQVPAHARYVLHAEKDGFRPFAVEMIAPCHGRRDTVEISLEKLAELAPSDPQAGGSPSSTAPSGESVASAEAPASESSAPASTPSDPQAGGSPSSTAPSGESGEVAETPASESSAASSAPSNPQAGGSPSSTALSGESGEVAETPSAESSAASSAPSDPQAGGSRLSRPPSSTASSGESGEAEETNSIPVEFFFPAGATNQLATVLDADGKPLPVPVLPKSRYEDERKFVFWAEWADAAKEMLEDENRGRPFDPRTTLDIQAPPGVAALTFVYADYEPWVFTSSENQQPPAPRKLEWKSPTEQINERTHEYRKKFAVELDVKPDWESFWDYVCDTMYGSDKLDAPWKRHALRWKILNIPQNKGLKDAVRESLVKSPDGTADPVPAGWNVDFRVPKETPWGKGSWVK